MSAALAWEITAPAGGHSSRPPRPRLVLVPTGDAVPAAPTTPLRITRFGRLVITLTVAAVLLTLAVVALGSRAGGAPAPTLDHATTVRQGQTLSQIAVEQLPQLPVTEAVVRIQLANNLPSTQVHAGQSLVIPAVR